MDLRVEDIVELVFLDKVRTDNPNSREYIEKPSYVKGIITDFVINKDSQSIFLSTGGNYEMKIFLDKIIRIKKVDLPKAGELSIKP